MSEITAQSIRDTLSAYNTGRFGVDVRYFAQVGSTSDIARELAGQGAPEGTVVMADEQTAGRGRMGRTWVAPPGSSLMFTAIFRPSLPPGHIYRLVMACGLVSNLAQFYADASTLFGGMSGVIYALAGYCWLYQRLRPEDIGRLRVRASNGGLVPLSTLVSMEEAPSLNTITRRDRERSIGFFANVAAGASQAQAVEEAHRIAASVLPEGYHVELSGSAEALRETERELSALGGAR